MAACVLAMLVVTPTVGAAVCLCADGVAISGATAEAVQVAGHNDSSACDAACCLGGHCHQGGAMLDGVIAPLPTPALLATALMPVAARTLASRTHDGLDRPPRA